MNLEVVMDSENKFEMFSQAVDKGDSDQLDRILNYFQTINAMEKLTSSIHHQHKRIVPEDFLTRPMNQEGEIGLEVAAKKSHWVILSVLLKQLKFHVYIQWECPSHLPLSFAFPACDKEFILDISHKIPIAKFIENLTSLKDDPLWLELILEADHQNRPRSSITRADTVFELERMGAAFHLEGSSNVSLFSNQTIYFSG